MKAFAERTTIPVAMTLLGIGAFPGSHPLNLGMMGMHGEAWVNEAVQQADLLIALGHALRRPRDRQAGRPSRRSARKIHVEIDPAEINKNVKVDVGAHRRRARGARDAAARRGAERSLGLAGAHRRPPAATRRRATSRTSTTTAASTPRTSSTTSGRPRAARPSSSPTSASTRCGRRSTTGTRRRARSSPPAASARWASPLPAAIGAKLARPDADVWAVVGDGGFQMTMAELGTLVQEGVKVNIAIINNGYLGMVRQLQEFFYGARYHATPLVNPDFVTLAERLRHPRHPRDGARRRHPGGRGRGGPRRAGPARHPRRTRRRGLPDGRRRGWSRPDDPAARPRRRSDEFHLRGVRRRQARRAEPRGLALPPPRVQHRVAHRRPHRHAGRLAHDDRRRHRPRRRAARSRRTSTSSSTCCGSTT